LLAALFFLGLYFFNRPRPIWYVEEEFQSRWGRIVRAAGPPFRRFAVFPRGKALPENRYGYIISPNPPGFERSETGVPVRIIPELSRTREWGGALALAVDPWMVFRKHQDPELERGRIDAAEGGEGLLLLPGGDKGAVFAWLSQLLQERPGVFPGAAAVWEEAAAQLFEGRRFQPGAMTYNWVDLWPLLNRRDLLWLYAPLSRIRALPPYRMGTLDATRFPVQEDWNIYGIQAEVLWAQPFGEGKGRKEMEAARDWLRRARTQTIIANEIDWIPAHPQGTPYNTVSWESQAAWINSSFIWQGAAYEGRDND
jgi:hypothetical protein